MAKKISKLLSFSDVEKFEKNPFILNLNGKMYIQPRANYVLAKKEAILDKETGFLKHDEDVLIGRKKFVDKSQFAKIYASEIGILFELSKTAINVFLYLTQNMDYDNKSFFQYTTQFEKLGYKTEVASLNGLRELLTKKVIALCDRPHHYWLNPLIVCKGERFAIYTEYVVDTSKEKADLQAHLQQQQIDNLPHNEKLELAKNADLFSSQNEKI